MGDRNSGNGRGCNGRGKLGDGWAVSVPAGFILLALMRLPVCYADRNDERVPAHLARIAFAISEEAKDVDEAAALVAIGKHESGFCMAVQHHETGSAAQSSWQLENKQDKYVGPFLGLSYEPIHNAAHAALDVYRHSWQCGPTFADRVTAYAARPLSHDLAFAKSSRGYVLVCAIGDRKGNEEWLTTFSSLRSGPSSMTRHTNPKVSLWVPQNS